MALLTGKRTTVTPSSVHWISRATKITLEKILCQKTHLELSENGIILNTLLFSQLMLIYLFQEDR